MWGANDPDSRTPMVWSDLEYEPETVNPDGSTREPVVVAVDEDLLAHYKRLIGIRNRHEALRVGLVTNFARFARIRKAGSWRGRL